MELEDYKKTRHGINQPAGNAEDAGGDPMKRLIDEMKEKDAMERKALLALVLVFGIFVVIYLAGMNTHKGTMRMGYALLAGGFGTSLLFFLIRFIKGKRINYTSPALVFLKSAERRYAHWTWQELVVSVPLTLIMGWGGGLIVSSSFEKYYPGSFIPVFIFSAVYLVALGTGYWAGRKQWEKNKRSVYEKIRLIIKEFNE